MAQLLGFQVNAFQNNAFQILEVQFNNTGEHWPGEGLWEEREEVRLSGCNYPFGKYRY